MEWIRLKLGLVSLGVGVSIKAHNVIKLTGLGWLLGLLRCTLESTEAIVGGRGLLETTEIYSAGSFFRSGIKVN